MRKLTRADKVCALILEAGAALSARELARRAGISERQAVRCRQKLVECGALEVIERSSGTRPPRYRRPGGMTYGN